MTEKYTRKKELDENLTTYSDEELLEWIHAFVEHFGIPPTDEDLRGWPGPSRSTYDRHFGSVRQAVIEAGYEPRRTK